MSFLLINPDGTVEAHCSPDVESVLGDSLGKKQARRLTHIEWDGGEQEWVCVWLESGKVLFTHRLRHVLVELEKAYVESLEWRDEAKDKW